MTFELRDPRFDKMKMLGSTVSIVENKQVMVKTDVSSFNEEVEFALSCRSIDGYEAVKKIKLTMGCTGVKDLVAEVNKQTT